MIQAGAVDSANVTMLALKEWGAAVHALLDGRQTVLLRKGGIGEKAFSLEPRGMAPRLADDRFVLFPTVAHSHAERVRPKHADLLPLGEADAGVRIGGAAPADLGEDSGRLTVRCGVTLAGVVEVAHPQRLPELADLHIWTDQSIQRDRVEFRPRKPLQILVVRAYRLPEPVTLPRLEAYGGCISWVDLPLSWDGAAGTRVHDEARLIADTERIRATVA